MSETLFDAQNSKKGKKKKKKIQFITLRNSFNITKHFKKLAIATRLSKMSNWAQVE